MGQTLHNFVYIVNPYKIVIHVLNSFLTLHAQHSSKTERQSHTASHGTLSLGGHQFDSLLHFFVVLSDLSAKRWKSSFKNECSP